MWANQAKTESHIFIGHPKAYAQVFICNVLVDKTWPFFKHNFCVKPYVTQRTPIARDPSVLEPIPLGHSDGHCLCFLVCAKKFYFFGLCFQLETRVIRNNKNKRYVCSKSLNNLPIKHSFYFCLLLLTSNM